MENKELDHQQTTVETEVQPAMEHKKVDMEELVKKYKNNTATDQEAQYVEERVYKARKLAKMRLRNDKYVPFFTRIKNLFVSFLVVLALLAIIAGVCFFKVSAIARDNMVVTKTGSRDLLYQFISENFIGNPDVEIVKESRKMVYTLPLERSYYLYEYKITIAGKGAYIVTIDSYSQLLEYEKY